MFFKGYVECDGKAAIEKFKNKPLKTLEEVKHCKSYGGVLDEHTILIDVDTEIEANILLEIVKSENLKCRVYQTKRGKHFLFYNSKVLKNSTNTRLAIGINADIKVGTRNSYEILKKDGLERSVEYDTLDYEELPYFLLPVKNKTNWQNIKARNNAFFNYILTLQGAGFDKQEARKTIQLINKFVIQNSLSDKELSVILRDEAFKKTVFFEEGKFSYHKFANFLISEHNIKRINGMLHIYKDGYYKHGQIELERAMKEHLPELRKKDRNELLHELDCLVVNDIEQSSSDYIVFRNGVYNIRTEIMTGFSPDIIVTNKINFDYVAGSYHALTDETLDNLAVHNRAIRLLIEEMVGYTLFRRNELRKMFILYGDKQNGKSTFLNMLKRLLGEDNHSVLDIRKLGDRFSTIMLVNKLANIGDDISDEHIPDASILKKIVTGESVDAEQKGQPKFQFKPYCKLIFSANSIPKIGRGSDRGAILSRICIVPFKAKFDKSNPDFKPFISDDLFSEDAMQYLINVGIAGLKRVLKNREFTNSEIIEKEVEEYELQTNPLLEYFKGLVVDDFLHATTSDVFREYVDFCLEESIESVNKMFFSKEVCNHFNLKTKVAKYNKKTQRIYIKK